MDKNVKRGFRIGIVLLMVVILGMQYKFNFNINRKPPSAKWSKSKKITNAKVNTFPNIQRNEQGYLLSVNDKDTIKLIQVDNLGEKLKEKDIKTGSEIINNSNLIKTHDGGYILDWCISRLNGNEEKYVKLDKNLNELGSKTVKDINEVKQVNNDILLKTYDNKIEVIDINKNKSKSIEVVHPIYANGIKIDTRYLVVFTTQEGYVRYFYYDESGISEIKDICAMNLATGQSIMGTSLGIDGKYIYLIIEKKTKDGFEIEEYSLPLNHLEEYKRTKIRIPTLGSDIENVVYIENKDGEAKFLASVGRDFGVKKYQNDIVEFSIKDNKISIGNYLSKSSQVSALPAICGDIALYCDYDAKNEDYDVLLTSTSDKFKQINNTLRSEEKAITLQDTLQGLMYSVVYIFVIGLKWILPSTMFIGIFSFFEYKFREKGKKILFTISSVITFLLKFEAIYVTNYKKFDYYLPNALSSVAVGFIITLLISAVCYGYGYLRYKEDLDAIPVAKFIPCLLLDSLITLMVFAPFML